MAYDVDVEQSRTTELAPDLTPLRDAAPYINGTSRPFGASRPLHDPWRGSLVTRVAVSSPEDVEAAVGAAVAAQPAVAALPVHRRAAILRQAASLCEERATDYAEAITRQTGKALKNTLREVRRAA